MLIAIKDLQQDDEIYPRLHFNQKTIQLYYDRLLEGAKFPPVEIQQIKVSGTMKTIVLDGCHRLQAHIMANKSEIDCIPWRPDKIFNKDDIADWVELKLHSAEANKNHGDRLTESDNRVIAETIAKKNPEIPEARIATALGVTQQTVSDWIGEIKRRHRASQNNLIFKLHLLGWIQQEIAEHPKIGITQNTISQERLSVLPEVVKLIKADYQAGKTVKEIADYNKLEQTVTWALLFNGLNDIERFSNFGNTEYGNEQPKLSDYWKFTEGDPRLGQSYAGRLYGQEAMNIIYRFSNQGDLVVDPMAGGGVTVDASLIFNRRCRAYDADPSKSGRDDIIKHDITISAPVKAQSCQLVIFDPPYFNKEAKAYETDKFFTNKQEFVSYIEASTQNIEKCLKQKGYLALLYGQYIDYDDNSQSILTLHLAKVIEQAGLTPILNIQSPLTFNNQWHGPAIEQAKKYNPWRILPVSRDWLIFIKG